MEGLPRNLNAEVQILGRMIRIGERAHEIAAKMKAEQFYAIRHQIIFEALSKVCESGNPSTPAICDALAKAGKLEHVGGGSYLMELADSVVSMVGWESDCALILDAYKRRQIIALGRWALSEAEEADDAESLLSATVERITSIVNGQGGSRSGYAHAASGLDSVLSLEMPRECPTGISWFDEIYTPRPGNYIVIGGFSGGGKTALAAGLAASIAKNGNALIASLEMSRDEIIERVIPWTANIKIGDIRGRRMSEDERLEARHQVIQRGLYITEAESIHEIEQSARALKISKGGIDAVFIDYLQLLEGGKKRGGGESNRAQEVAAISRHCKLMARRLDCVVYALSQLNNDASREGVPKLHHLKESGGIRQDADAIFMIYHPEPEELAKAKRVILTMKNAQRTVLEDQGFQRAKIVSSKRVLDLQKGRSAAETATELMFEGPYTRFRKAESSEWSMKA
jgi:replicative DNA helicase